MARKPVKKTTRKATKKTTKKATKRTTKKITRKRSSSTQTKKRTQAKSKKKPTMNSTQKRLQERILNPWVRMETFEFENPVVYDIPWGDRFLSGIIQAKNIPGFGYVTDGVDERAQDYIAPDYSWMSFAMNKANKTVTTPNPKGKNPGNYQLRDDQKEDQETILRAREQGAPEFLIANGTGTGKTVTTWDTVKKINPKTALIVCPAAVIPMVV